MRHIERNPFARHTLIRVVEHDRPGQGCTWCGYVRTVRAVPQPPYRYGLDRDSGPIAWYRGLFCSRRCLESYMGGNAAG